MSLTKVSYTMIEGAYINVLDFGATGDGITNDTAAIQAAIDSLNPGGGTIFLPDGTYKVDTLVWPFNRGPTGTGPDTVINLIGAGMTSTILLMNDPTKPVIAVSRAAANERVIGSTLSDFAVKAHPSGSTLNANHIAIDAIGFCETIFRRIKFMDNGTGSVCIMFRTSAQPQLTYSQVFEGIVASQNTGPRYVLKTEGNGVDLLANTNLIQVRDCWIYANNDMYAAFDMSACSLYQIINNIIESTGEYGVIMGNRGFVMGNWFESINTAPLEFVDTAITRSSENTIISNYFSGFSGAIILPNTGNTNNLFINNAGGNWTLTGPARKFVIGAGATPAAPTMVRSSGVTGTLALLAANLRSTLDMSYEIAYTFTPASAGNVVFSVTPPTGYTISSLVASAYDGANGIPYLCSVAYLNGNIIVTVPNTNVCNIVLQAVVN